MTTNKAVTASLMPLMNARKMLDLCMRGKTLTAAEAMQNDLVSDVVPAGDLDKTVAASRHRPLDQNHIHFRPNVNDS